MSGSAALAAVAAANAVAGEHHDNKDSRYWPRLGDAASVAEKD